MSVEKIKRPIQSLIEKNKAKEPLIIHVLVPLCDNENQGIVPVPKKLGNGLDPYNNLYWGALYGVKTHFKRSKTWKLVSSSKNVNDNVLERIVFESSNSQGNKVLLIADAYRGDKMKTCLQDYFSYLAGGKNAPINSKITAGSASDLIVFNGHNGLMEYDLTPLTPKDNKVREAMAIGCISYDYFHPHWKKSKSYPILSTNHLMAPEAYILEAALNSWKNENSSENIHLSSAKAYNKYQKCGINGAKNIFHSGWK